MPSFLLVPSLVKGNGSGHLVRCLNLARELDRIDGCAAGVFLPDEYGSAHWGSAEIGLSFPEQTRGLRILQSVRESDGWDFIVLDLRSVDVREERRWRALAPTIAVDEGGAAFASASWCVDILPRLPSGRRLPRANLESRGLLALPKRRRAGPPERLERVLLAFGGEDPADLGPATARCLVEAGLFRPEALTLVSGALRKGPGRIPEGIRVLGPVQDLKEHLASYDLVLTQFGLTAFEAAWARCAVFLVNPGPYHSALARQAGFPEAGVGSPSLKALTSLLGDPAARGAAAEKAAPERPESLAARLAALRPGAAGVCPVCGERARTAVARHPGKSHFRCGNCGMVYRELFEGTDTLYAKSYFFEEYEKQYGRTYLEDFPALTAFAAARLDVLEKLLPRRKEGARLSVLDVGCAYGAFLAEAARRGWDGRGIDIAQSAVDYVQKELAIPAIAGDFLEPRVQAELAAPVDCLSLWFVVEHFDRLGEVLSAAARIVRPGGLLALSTPSGAGVSARRDPAAFYGNSPNDHVTVWEPRRTAGILKRYGFRVERIRVTGHHPERFPGALGGPALRSVSGLASRMLGLGDTFECYARRVPDAGSQEV